MNYSDITRPIASAEDFTAKLGVTKEKGTCIEGPSSPFIHEDLANGTCYHYVVTVVTPNGESPNLDEFAGRYADKNLRLHGGALVRELS